MSKNVGIMVVAQFIPQNIVDRFIRCIEQSKPSVSFDIHILRSKDKTQKINHFNKSKILNKGIKKLVNMGYEVLIQTDIDLIVPPKIIDESYEISMSERHCFHVNHRRITIEKVAGFPKLPEEYNLMDWDFMMKFPKEASNGCWNSLQSKYWYDTGGFNENCVNWSREDDDWARRAKIYGKIPFVVSNMFPLMHINHPQRNFNNRKHNDVVVRKAIMQGKINWLN